MLRAASFLTFPNSFLIILPFFYLTERRNESCGVEIRQNKYNERQTKKQTKKKGTKGTKMERKREGQ
jgi:hypothetical protein